MSRFYVQDEGVYVPTDDLAQAFAALNFIQENSFGIGNDTLVPVSNPDNPGWIADIKTKDLWGFVGIGTTAEIYRLTNVGIGTNIIEYRLDVHGDHHVTEDVQFDSSLNVDGDVTFNSPTSSSDQSTGALVVTQGGVGIEENLNVGGDVTFNSPTSSSDQSTGALVVTQGGVGIEENLNVGGDTKLIGSLELDSTLIDINGEIAGPSVGKTDYRLSSIGTGVSWRPPGVQTENTIWVTKDGNDNNSGFLEGDAKYTIGAAAAIAQDGDTIKIRPGRYIENNPIGLRNNVTISGEDLRLVAIEPLNKTKDVFHVRRGCLIENVNFSGATVGVKHPGCAAVAFPPTQNDIDSGIAFGAVSGYTDVGPADDGGGPVPRWRSPYIRNSTNFMSESIGMKINGDHATASEPGQNLKCMVCDSFTQYNENGIGVSITNNGYAQLVSIFTINCDKAIYCDSGGSCDLTNSNSSFGNYGLYAVGIGSTEFTGNVGKYPPDRIQNGVSAESDVVAFKNIGNNRRPYDGQKLFFKINLDNYPDSIGSGTIQEPMVEVQEIKITNPGNSNDYSAAAPPSVIIRDSVDLSQQPKGPQGIIAELSPNITIDGKIDSIDVINSGRNYLSSQNLEVIIDGGNAVAEVITRPIYYSIDSATENSSGVSTVTFTQFIPYELFGNEEVSFKRISRILTSSHSFEYVGSGTSINTASPFNGGVAIKENEIVALDGAEIPFTSTDQKGNFDIGEGFQINQPTSTIRGRDFSKAIQAEVTPLILALR